MIRTHLALLGTLILVGCGSGSSTQPQTAQTETATYPPAATTPETTAPAAESATPTTPSNDVAYADVIKASDHFVQQGDANSAVRLLSKAIQSQPKQPAAYIKRAGILAEAKMLIPAVNDLTTAISLSPKSAKLHNTRGYFLLLLKEFEKAEADFNAAIDINPEYPQALNNRGLVFIAQEEFEKAAADFRIAIDLDQEYTDAMNNLGYALIKMEEFDDAIAAFNQVLELNPEYLNALNNRGQAHFAKKDHDAAIADFTACIEKSAGQIQYYQHRIEAYKAAGQEELARKDVERIVWGQELNAINAQVSAKPKDADLWVARAHHLFMGDETDAATESYNKAIEIDAQCAAAYAGRAQIHAANEDYEQVIADCTEALKTTTHHGAYSLRGDAYAKLGQTDEALADYEAARRIDADVAALYRQRADQREAAGQTDLAKQDREIATAIETRLTAEGLPASHQGTPREFKIEQVGYDETEPETVAE